MVLLQIVVGEWFAPCAPHWMASTGGHAMRDKPKIIPHVAKGPPHWHSAFSGIGAAAIMAAVWAILIVIALLWLGALVSKLLA